MVLNRKLLYILTLVFAYAITLNLTPKYFFLRGELKYKNGDYIVSEKYINKALIFKPEDSEYRFAYIKTLSELKPNYSVQRKMYDIANSKQNDGAKILAKEKIKEWKKNININVGQNYIDQAPSDSKIIRWNKNSFPLQVYIGEDDLVSMPEYYKTSAIRALKQWETSVDFVSFVITDNPNKAQIAIFFKNIPQNVCKSGTCKYVVGYTKPTITRDTLKNMEITIYKTSPKGEYLSDIELYNTILHELGHALGIIGHSYSMEDLMYVESKDESSIFQKYHEDFHYITGSDINTLTLLYMLDPSITDKKQRDKSDLIYTPIILGTNEEIAKKKIIEATKYIETSPELAIGYINLSGAYIELKDYHNAIDALNKALDFAKDKNEKFIIYYNLAYIYSNQNKCSTALKYAKLAKEIQTTQDVLEMIGILEDRLSKTN